MIDWWTVIGDSGAVASILGGYYAWKQAYKAKGYAEGILQGKKDVKDRSVSNRLSEFKSLTKETKNQLGPTYVEGKTVKEIQTMLNEYLTSYSEILGTLDDKTSKQLKELYQSIHTKASLLADNALQKHYLSETQYLLGKVIVETSKIVNESTFQ